MTLHRDDEPVVNIAGTYIPAQKEIRWPTDRAQEGFPEDFDDISAFLDDGTPVDLEEDEIERAKARLFEEMEECA